jgi:diguanylate cyclase (GGDEF)-like protein/PAS domain S-box-containing protein
VNRSSPIFKITIALVLITASILLVGDMLGLMPNVYKASLEARKKFVESLAVQLSYTAEKADYDTISVTMQSIVDRNEDVLSAALRRDSDDKLIAESGNHLRHWVQPDGDSSTPIHAQVPIFQGDRRWGTVEVSFSPIAPKSLLGFMQQPFVRLMLFVAISGFVGYLLLLKRTLRQLDPTQVIPGRVQAALDVLAEGVLIIDTNEQIVLANHAFSHIADLQPADLLGRQISEIDWNHPEASGADAVFPWTLSLEDGRSHTGIPLTLSPDDEQVLTFAVNCAPITDDRGNKRGVMVTFDDVTELEKKNEELESAKTSLQESLQEIGRKNKELEVLARDDPLTGCLNRRSFFERFRKEFNSARLREQKLACIMCDIDFFKAINDNYGHAVGDTVIRRVADALKSVVRKHDMIGRYGGEEFCIILHETDAAGATAKAEHLRALIQQLRFTEDEATQDMSLTASFGVSDMSFGSEEPTELVDQADKALYDAKETGRNRVIRWDQIGEAPRQDSAQARPMSMAERIKNIGATSTEAEPTTTAAGPGAEGTQPPVTGRQAFIESVRKALKRRGRAEDRIAVLLIDIDNFKRINKTLDHEAGDHLLAEVGVRLNAMLRESDTVARMDDSEGSLSRLGGDEFGVLIPYVPSANVVQRVVDRVRAIFDDSILVEGHDIRLTCSIGIAVAPTDGDMAEELIKNADVALHSAKDKGANSYQFYEKSLAGASTRQLVIENQLGKALETGRFLLYYQPKVDLATSNIIAMEALMRWPHPELGMVPPKEFIQVAEQTGMINALGDWVLRTACTHAKVWLESGNKDLKLSINLSPMEFRDDKLVDRVRAILERTGFPADQLEFEITESTVMSDLENAINTMNRLVRMGIRLAIDDFGTGYTSLYYLKRFPIDTLKIDRQFTNELEDDAENAAIVRAIIAMAHSLNLTVVAEGVETEEQLEFLTEAGCDEIQGYLFSRPVADDKVAKLLAADLELPSSASISEKSDFTETWVGNTALNTQTNG